MGKRHQNYLQENIVDEASYNKYATKNIQNYVFENDIFMHIEREGECTFNTTVIPRKLQEILLLQYHDGTLVGHLSSRKHTPELERNIIG